MFGANAAKPVKALLALHTAGAAPAGEGNSASSAPAPASSSGQVSLGLQESQAISTDYVISELSVEHPSICQLLKTSDRGVSVIGMRVGTTRIALISTDASGERRIEVRDVIVNADARGDVNLGNLAQEITQTVNQLYPKSDVQIVVEEDRLMVRGYTNYESDAKKILALVRKTSLAPVVDQLTTSGN
jgi:Flp pilus assembly secretin CpaC